MDSTRTIREVDAGLAPSAAPAPALVVVHHPDPRFLGERLALGGEPLLLGRGLGPAGLLADPLLSRRHAEVERRGPGAVVRDLGSANGTTVNGQPVTEADLAPGDVLGVGGLLLLLRIVDPRVAAPRHPALIGVSGALGRVLEEVALVAPRQTGVLLLGETGTGKELVAREIHRLSGRRGPFVAVNCGGVADAVLHSELFGHARGAFTGADRARRGLAEEAHDGTLFLDEVGEASPGFQAALLRLLQEGEIRPVGENRAIKVDVRVVAATHQPLEAQAAAGRFRADLLARLARWVIALPPLRDRAEDVPVLARWFAERFAGRPVALSRALALALVRSPWPGNVRQLEAAVERLVVEARGREVLELPPGWEERAAEIAPSTPTAPAPAAPGAKRRASGPRPDADALRAALRGCGGNMRELARALGVGRSTLYRWFEEENIDPNEGR